MNGPIVLPPPPPLHDLLSTGPLALFLDFDGTLVEIAPTPDGIRVPQGLASGLTGLALRTDGRLALVSGRSTEDIERHLGPLAIARAGSHGISRLLADGSRLGGDPSALPAAVSEALEQFAALHDFPLEGKPHGAALHFRARPELESVGAEFAHDIAARHGLRVKRGKSVIEIVHPGADKGGAVRAFMGIAPFAGARPVFIGDDITDDDGFRAASEQGGFGILVGERKSPDARYHLPRVADLHEWLGL